MRNLSNKKLQTTNYKLLTRYGFTLVELITVIALTITVGAVGFISMARYRNTNDMKLSLEEVATAMRSMQKRSVSQQDGKRWGVHFYTSSSSISSYTTFKGTSYAGGTTELLYGLRRSIYFSNPFTSSTYDMIFAPITGKPSENKVMSMVFARKDGIVGDVIVRTSGSITTRREIGMAGYWHLDEGTATSTYDASGLGNTGSSTAVMWASGSSCKAGGCITFNGTNDYVKIANESQFDFERTNSFSVAVWVKHTSSDPSNVQLVWAKSDADNPSAGSSRGYLLAVRGDLSGNPYEFTFDSNSANNTIVVRGSGVSDTNWHHIVVAYDGSSSASGAKIYVDGIAMSMTIVTNTLSATTLNNVNFEIGSRDGGTLPFSGSLDEVRIYNRALSANEIKQLYEGRIFQRSFSIENVCRTNNSSSTINSVAPCAGGDVNDPLTQKITAITEWTPPGGSTSQLNIVDYITRTRNAVFHQSDWSGGRGQDGPLTEPNNKFASGTSVATSTPGFFRIQGL